MGKDHLQFNIIPISLDRLSQAVIVLKTLSEKYQVQFIPFEGSQISLSEVLGSVGSPGQYFYIDIPVQVVVDGVRVVKRERYYSVPAEGQRFPLSFGLELAANVIGDPDKAHWKNCIVSEDQEKTQTDNFRELFGAFDFTLE